MTRCAFVIHPHSFAFLESYLRSLSPNYRPRRKALMKKIHDSGGTIDGLSNLSWIKLFSLVHRSASILPQLMQAERLARGESTEIIRQEYPTPLAVKKSVTTRIEVPSSL